MLPLIGVTGYKRHGKDTVVKRLVDRWGMERRAFADELKFEVWQAINANRDLHYCHSQSVYENFEDFLTYLDDNKGAPEGSERTWVRQILQAWGSMRRDLDGISYWINRFEPTPNLAFADVRMPNEAAWLHENKGILLRVHRGSQNNTDSHASEIHVATLPADFEIENNGTIEELNEKVDAIVELLR